MRKLLKKGFTIVELVIVIAVIAILAAVLIPTFAGVIDKANTSAALQTARSTLTNALNMTSTGSLAGQKTTGEYQTMIAVDGYAFGYTGNQLKQIDHPTSDATAFYHTVTAGKNSFNAILLAAENVVEKENDDANYTVITSETAPTDWSTSYINYYTKSADNKYSKVAAADAAPTWAKNTYYTKNVVSFEVKNVQGMLTKYAKSTNEYGCTDIASISNVKLVGDQYYLNYTSSTQFDAKIFVNSDFVKNVVVFTTFTD